MSDILLWNPAHTDRSVLVNQQEITYNSSVLTQDVMLCFDLLTRPKMHRKEVTHSGGSYERKSRGRKLADEMGRGKKKILLYSHRLTHRKRVTSKLDDNYFRSMTITQAIPKKAEGTHPGPQISEVVVEACPY